MLVYDVKDYTGAESRHLAIDKEAAIQAHLIHYGLLYLKEPPEVSNGIPLSKFKNNRKTICWDLSCCLAGGTKG